MADEIFDALLGDVGSGGVSLDAPDLSDDPIFSELLDRAKQKRREENVLAAKAGAAARPDQYAEHLHLSKQFGVPIDYVGRNRDKLVAFKGYTDIRDMLDKNATLGRWYASGDNAAAVKVDELRHLDGLSWFYEATGQAFSSGRTDVDLASLRYRQLLGIATGDEVARADELSRGRVPRSYGADSWLEKGWTGAMQQLPIMGETLMESIAGGAGGAVAGGGAALVGGQLGPQVALPEELITVPAGAAVGFRVGSLAGQWHAAFKLEAGLAYDEFRNLRDEDGNAMDDDVARAAAVVAGSASSLLETYGFRKMASVVPGLDRVSGMLGRDAIKEALKRPGIRDALKNFATNSLEVGATEVTTEIAQEALTLFAGELAKAYSNADGSTRFDFVTPEDAAARLADTFEQTLQAMTIMGPALATSRLGMDARRAQQARRDALTIDMLHQHAEGNELNARMPDKAMEAVRAL
ncbi:MAG: hypothetical protein KDA41_12170, partial [Planctomycetales bacterium]|nr:hypothetical protein [Planctomycetales bacterium]